MSKNIQRARMIMTFRELIELENERQDLLENSIHLKDDLKGQRNFYPDDYVEDALTHLRGLGLANDKVKAMYEELSAPESVQTLIEDVEAQVKDEKTRYLAIMDRVEEVRHHYLMARFGYAEAGGLCLDCEIDGNTLYPLITHRAGFGGEGRVDAIYEGILDNAEFRDFDDKIKEAGLQDHVYIKPDLPEKTRYVVNRLVFTEQAKDKVIDILIDLMEPGIEDPHYADFNKDKLRQVFEKSVGKTDMIRGADRVLPLKGHHIKMGLQGERNHGLVAIDQYLADRKAARQAAAEPEKS